MYAQVPLWNVTGRNRLGAVCWRMDIAASNKSDAIYVAKNLSKNIETELTFSVHGRKKQGEPVRVGIGYISQDY